MRGWCFHTGVEDTSCERQHLGLQPHVGSAGSAHAAACSRAVLPGELSGHHASEALSPAPDLLPLPGNLGGSHSSSE